ncbi:hypothetical protein CERSUDRAFT_76667 [Gelatoporia subvermispora B]|uniref:Uncharacterized protein n=1 Tax=Ceriporiopsis subvermispora (strain B) TaxID=914234 RepID=M2QMR9_CERS8|nr:hypothetical protein CERSUDRAFT_76667 [Gelatoporia subvermispora B]
MTQLPSHLALQSGSGLLLLTRSNLTPQISRDRCPWIHEQRSQMSPLTCCSLGSLAHDAAAMGGSKRASRDHPRPSSQQYLSRALTYIRLRGRPLVLKRTVGDVGAALRANNLLNIARIAQHTSSRSYLGAHRLIECTVNLGSGGATQSVNGLGENVILARRVPTDDRDHACDGLLYQPIAIAHTVQRADWMPGMRQTAWNEPSLGQHGGSRGWRWGTTGQRVRKRVRRMCLVILGVSRVLAIPQDEHGTNPHTYRCYLDDRRRSVRGSRTQLADSRTDYNQDLKCDYAPVNRERCGVADDSETTAERDEARVGHVKVEETRSHPHQQGETTTAGVPAPIGIVALVEPDDCVASRYEGWQWRILDLAHNGARCRPNCQQRGYAGRGERG